MPKISRVGNEPGRLLFRCPACAATSRFFPSGHAVNDSWAFNGDMDRPTLSPSVKCKTVHPETGAAYICHFFVRDGQIEYCGDCTHAMAGKTVPMLDMEAGDA